VKSVQEAIEIGRQSAIPIHISHIKALGVDVWGKSHDLVTMIERARAEGIYVTANQYPYHASRTSLVAALIPRWAEGMGSKQMIEVISAATTGDSIMRSIAENIRKRGGGRSLQISGSANDSLEQKTLEEVASMWNTTMEEAVVKLIQRDANLRVVSFNMSENDLEYFTKQRWVMTASDGTPGHPRKYGSFVKRLKDYALDKKIVTPAFVIHASSGLTAETLGIKKRGFIREGYYADIIVFDPKTLDTKATFENPDVFAEGMIYVVVNGVLAIDNRTYTGKLSGRSLKH
jgi:N-acyl-D-aspartate/D-glutamate deacylase